MNNANDVCQCGEMHDNIITFLNNKVDSIYSFRDRYFENHKIEEAIKKKEDIEKLLSETTQVFDKHEHLITDATRARFNYLKGKLLNILPIYNKNAENLLSKSIKLDPKLVDAWNELGECYSKNDDLEKSISCFECALKEENNKYSLRNLSILARQQKCNSGEERVKNIEKGISYAKEAVLLDPQDGLSWTVLGNAHFSSFFGIQQDPTILKRCLSAYSQAEKDFIAVTTPDLHYNKGMTLKYEENFKMALESFNKASLYDPTWQSAIIKEQQLLKYLNDIQELVTTSGKMKAKRLNQIIQSIDTKLLGPYNDGNYTLSNNQSVKLEYVTIASLKVGMNSAKVVLGKVVCSIRNEDTVPFTFCMVDKEGTCAVVTIYNLAEGKGVIIGDSVAVPLPMVNDVDFTYKDNVYKFRLIRVETPVILVVNSKILGREFKAGVQVSIVKKFE